MAGVEKGERFAASPLAFQRLRQKTLASSAQAALIGRARAVGSVSATGLETRHVNAHRRHVESAFSQRKRRHGSALTSRSGEAQQRELVLHVLTPDLALLKGAA